MEYKKLDEIIDFNPKEKIAKKRLVKKIPMDNLNCFTKYIKSYSLEEYNGGMKFRNGDTLLARITPCLENGKTSKVTILDENEVGFGSTEYIVMRSKRDISDEDFIFYLAISPKFRDIAIKSMTGTSGRQRVQLDVVKNTEMLVPSYQEQVKIGKTLSNIDNKIELNNQINNNLHEILNSLYRAWFVEHSVSETKDYPDWNFKYLKDYANCILGGTPSRAKEEYWNGNVNWINSGEVNKFRILEPSEMITDLGLQKSSTTLLPVGATVLAITGATLGQVSRLEIDTCANQSVVGVISKSYLSNEYIYLSILNNIEEIIKNQTGGAQQHINKGNVEDFKILVPSQTIMEKFNTIIKPIFYKIRENCFENKNLEQLRDTLLSKLMNGEIDLHKIEI